MTEPQSLAILAASTNQQDLNMKTLTSFAFSLLFFALGFTGALYLETYAPLYMIAFFVNALSVVTLWGYNRGFDE